MNTHNKQAPRVALVTGAARRIGASIATYLHKAGFDVLIHYYQAQKEAETLTAMLNQARNNSALCLHANLIDKSAIEALINHTMDWKNKLDLLVNNASLFARSDETLWDDLWTLNVKAPYWLSYMALPFLSKNQGSIINITDRHSEIPLKGYSIYCQSKAALSMQTKSLAREFAPKVRVNAVAPGAIAWPEKNNALTEREQQAIIERTPLKQHGNPIYIAQAVLSLVENPFITGQSLVVDGGRGLT